LKIKAKFEGSFVRIQGPFTTTKAYWWNIFAMGLRKVPQCFT
jgi:hypothetical protein